LNDTIEADRYPLSPRIRPLRGIRDGPPRYSASRTTDTGGTRAEASDAVAFQGGAGDSGAWQLA
jgi:hypothetical protein